MMLIKTMYVSYKNVAYTLDLRPSFKFLPYFYDYNIKRAKDEPRKK